jgi:hypothetical protein
MVAGVMAGQTFARRDHEQRNNETTAYGMHCPDLRALGTWLLDAEPLLTAGLAWYLPSYSSSRYTLVDGIRHNPPDNAPQPDPLLDYLIKDGRAVDASGADPIKSKIVRPVLHTELPFLQGVSLRDFSRITVEEFASFVAFRDFLRLSLLGLDDALNDVQSEREMLKIGLKINDEVRAMRAEMIKAQRRRALSASGAVLGAAGTILLAVYGPALATAIAALGASGGVWGFINAMSEGSTTVLRENKWYYVWALTKKELMRTYYRGPVAIVTEASLTIDPPSGRSFALSDLDPDQLVIKSEASSFSLLFPTYMFIAASLLGCMSSTAGIMWNNWWVALGGIAGAAVILIATDGPAYQRYGDDYVLVGVYQGVETRLYVSSSEAKTFQIRYAVREALEDGPAATTT